MIPLLRVPYEVFDDGFWKGDPKFIFMLHWHILTIFNHQRIIRLLHFGRDFPTAGEILEVVEEIEFQEVEIPKNTCLEGTSLRQTASFELSCVEIALRVWAVRVARKRKKN